MELTLTRHLYNNTTIIRIDDINFGNHLDSSTLVSLLHNTRANFLKQYGLSETDCFGVGLILLSIKIEYLCEAFFGDILIFDLYLEKFEKAEIAFSYIVKNESKDKILAQAKTIMGFFNLEKRKLTKPPAKFINFINSIIK